MVRLGDLFIHIRNGANIKQGLDDSGYPITRIETISNRIVDRNKMGYAGIKDLSKYQDFVLQDGDILMSHINSETHLGKTALYEKVDDEIIIHGMNLLLLRPNKNLITSKYAFYYFSSQAFLKQIPNITKKSVNQASFTVSALKELSFPEVSLTEQKIAIDNLDKVSMLIKHRKQQLSKLDELVKARFVDMFGDIKTGEYKFETKKLGEVSDVGSSHRVFTTEFVEEGVPFYRGTEIGELANGIKPEKPYRITKEHYDRLASDETKPKIGDLLMPSICNKGQVWMVDTEEPFYYKDGRVLCISPNRKLFNCKYLEQFMREKTLVEYPKLGSGSTFAEFKIFLLKDIDVLIPPVELQNEFATFVEKIDKSKFDVQQSLEKLETLKKSLMQQYFG